MTPQEREQRGRAARQVLENDLYDESWTGSLKAVMNEWANSGEAAPETRERLFWKYRGLMDARDHLEGIIEDGKWATDELKREEDEK